MQHKKALRQKPDCRGVFCPAVPETAEHHIILAIFDEKNYNPIFDSLRAEKAKILRKIKGFGFLRLAYFFCLFRFSKNFFHLF